MNVGITTVVDFLQKKGYTVEANPNTKITEEQYAALIKEFSKDKDLKIESEKIIQERQNKERNKASVSIEDIRPELKKPEVIETVVPEDVRPKFKPVGKIDLDGLKKKKKPAVVEPAEMPVAEEGPAKPEPENKQAEVEKTEVKTEEAPVQQPQVEEKQEPKQPEMTRMASKYPKFYKIYNELEQQNNAIYKKEKQRSAKKKELSEIKGWFKGRKKKELQKEIEELKSQIRDMKDYLPRIVKKIGYRSVQEFLKDFKDSQTEYSQYRTAIEKWKIETGKEPVAHGISAKLA